MGKIFYALMLLLFVSGCAAPEKEKDVNMEASAKLDDLKNMVLEDNWDAADLAEELGAEAVPTLTDLMQNKNPEIRSLALNCLDLTGDESALPIIVESLKDPDDNVRSTAMQALEARYDKTVQKQMVENLNNPDPAIRGGVALLLGNLGGEKTSQPLHDRLEKETDADAGRDIRLSLAKLGDDKYKEEFASNLDIPDSKVRYKAIEDLRYIGDKNLAKYLLPALSDTGEVFNIGDKDRPVYGRVCDAAIMLLGEWFEKPFSYEVVDYRRYTDEEIEEAVKFLKGLGGQKDEE